LQVLKFTPRCRLCRARSYIPAARAFVDLIEHHAAKEAEQLHGALSRLFGASVTRSFVVEVNVDHVGDRDGSGITFALS
jgi:hypothetical protein